MKKPYNKPSTVIEFIAPTTLLSGSITGSTVSEDKIDQGVDGLSRQNYSVWDDEEDEE